VSTKLNHAKDDFGIVLFRLGHVSFDNSTLFSTINAGRQKTSKSPDDRDIHGQLLGWVVSSKTIKNNQHPKSPKSQEVAL